VLRLASDEFRDAGILDRRQWNVRWWHGDGLTAQERPCVQMVGGCFQLGSGPVGSVSALAEQWTDASGDAVVPPEAVPRVGEASEMLAARYLRDVHII